MGHCPLPSNNSDSSWALILLDALTAQSKGQSLMQPSAKALLPRAFPVCEDEPCFICYQCAPKDIYSSLFILSKKYFAGSNSCSDLILF